MTVIYKGHTLDYRRSGNKVYAPTVVCDVAEIKSRLGVSGAGTRYELAEQGCLTAVVSGAPEPISSGQLQTMGARDLAMCRAVPGHTIDLLHKRRRPAAWHNI